jgi:protein-disulfide isomerase
LKTEIITEVDPEPTVRAPFSLDGVALLGDPAAPLVMVEFGDYQCGACAQFGQTIFPELKERYIDTGKLRFAYRHMPSPARPFAREAAEAAACAAEQGRFWAIHEALMVAAPRLDAASIAAAADTAAVDRKALDACVASGAGRAALDQDVREALAQRLRSTPTFMFGQMNAGGRFQPRATIAGTGTSEGLYQAIDTLLKRP